jgi:hypothetical protein
MDMEGAGVAEIPEFKLAKVGKGRERKRGGLAWFGARGAGVAGSGMSLAKLLVTLLVVGGVSTAAWQMGSIFSVNTEVGARPADKKSYSDAAARKYDDLSGVIKTENSIPNSLGYVSGSSDGLTPEERAKKAAADAAAAKAADDAQQKADANAQKNADDGNPATADSGGGKRHLSAGRFGGMRSSFGGGGSLIGGSGLAGGINGSFGGPTLGAKVRGGPLAAFRAPTKSQSSSVSHRAAGRSSAKGFARQQLDGAAGASRQATGTSKSETASSGAASPFDASPAGGSVISGPGVGAGTSQGGADSIPSATGRSGPIAGGATPACTNGYEPDINGNCQPISTPAAKNAAPYQWMIDAVKVLMGIVALLALYMLYLKYVAVPAAMTAAAATLGAASPAIAALIAQITFLGHAILAVGALIAMMGVMIIAASGDIMMGGIITAIGGFIAASMLIPEMLAGVSIPMIAAGGLIMAAGGYMAAANVKPASMQ